MALSEHFSAQTIRRTRSIAHVIERLGLALVGVACGLFVAAHLSQSRDEILGSLWVLALMTAGGALGFYFGIDIPPHSVAAGRFDPPELAGAIGTFLAAIAALTSVYMLVGDGRGGIAFTTLNAACWLLGVTMQTVSGFIARARAL
jgi:FtsH-binding integral membrane protein